MAIWEVKPTESVGKVRFGSDRKEVREILGNSYQEFKKSRFSKNTTDDYGDFHVFYDVDNKCEAIEIFENIELKIDKMTIFPGTMSIIELIGGFDYDGYCYINKEKSIGLSCHEEKIDSILLGKKNYYN